MFPPVHEQEHALHAQEHALCAQKHMPHPKEQHALQQLPGRAAHPPPPPTCITDVATAPLAATCAPTLPGLLAPAAVAAAAAARAAAAAECCCCCEGRIGRSVPSQTECRWLAMPQSFCEQ